MKTTNTILRNTFLGLLALLFVNSTSIYAQELKTEFKHEEGVKNYTHLNFPTGPAHFQFAVVGDRTGGGRPGVFPAAVDMLNLLQPEFVVNIGDMIEGYVEDEATLLAMWEEIDASLQPLRMPFFTAPGNHDVNLDPSEKVWFDRAGVKRSYSHFIYNDVLFLLVSTEDPPKNDPGPDMEEKYNNVKAGKVAPAEAREIIVELETWAGQVNISDAQVAYFEKVLKENPDVRWTFAFMHTPAWTQPDPGNFTRLEALLQDRPYTVFAGHTHTYEYTQRNGRDYITMGLTGGLAPESPGLGNMDHLALVTMTETGPVIGNVLMNGITDKRGAVPVMEDFLLYRPRQITQTGHSLGIRSVPNLRDLGGYKTSDGRIIRNGLLYRSNQLSEISEADMQVMSSLRLKNAYDLRTLAEREARPEELPEAAQYVVLDVLADAEQANPAMLEKLMQNPEEANATLGDGKAEAGFIESYRQFVSLPSAQREFRKFFLGISNPEELPALFHCTTGKDRTGSPDPAFLTLMDVPRDKVYEDYLKSNDYILPAYKKVIDGFVAAGGEENIVTAILGVRKEYLDAAFDEMESRYGTIENYFAQALDIDAKKQQQLKELYLY